jgi:hypothetical protein
MGKMEAVEPTVRRQWALGTLGAIDGDVGWERATPSVVSGH